MFIAERDRRVVTYDSLRAMLIAERDRRGLSQRAFASLLGISQAHLSGLERGKGLTKQSTYEPGLSAGVLVVNGGRQSKRMYKLILNGIETATTVWVAEASRPSGTSCGRRTEDGRQALGNADEV